MFRQTVVILALTIVKDINCEDIRQRCSNEQIKYKKTEKPPLTRGINGFVFNGPIICEEAEQVILNNDSILHLLLLEKSIKRQDIGVKYISYNISKFRGASVVFDSYSEPPITTDNTHKCHSEK